MYQNFFVFPLHTYLIVQILFLHEIFTFHNSQRFYWPLLQLPFNQNGSWDSCAVDDIPAATQWRCCYDNSKLLPQELSHPRTNPTDGHQKLAVILWAVERWSEWKENRRNAVEWWALFECIFNNLIKYVAWKKCWKKVCLAFLLYGRVLGMKLNCKTPVTLPPETRMAALKPPVEPTLTMFNIELFNYRSRLNQII